MRTLIVTRPDQTEFPVRGITSMRVGRTGRDEGALVCMRGTERVHMIRAGLWTEWRWED